MTNTYQFTSEELKVINGSLHLQQFIEINTRLTGELSAPHLRYTKDYCVQILNRVYDGRNRGMMVTTESFLVEKSTTGGKVTTFSIVISRPDNGALGNRSAKFSYDLLKGEFATRKWRA